MIIQGFKTRVFIFAILMFAVFVFLMSRGRIYGPDETEYGITFSSKKAADTSPDWRQTFLKILDDLRVKKLRLIAYWDEVEPTEGAYDWSNIDWQLDRAAEHGATVILAVGGRLPRWPECHFPAWSSDFSQADKEASQLEYLKTAIERYRGRAEIVAWQIENEPFLPYFGECPKLDKNFLDREIALVKSLDSRPVVITDSGELSIWIPAARRADIFGATMYRDTYSSALGRYVHYPITPAFFRFKKNFAGIFASPEDWIVIELAAEPWGPAPYEQLSKEDRDRTMSLEKFREMIKFSRQAGFREFYLWGAEYWHWECFANADCSFWNEAKTLFKNLKMKK